MSKLTAAERKRLHRLYEIYSRLSAATKDLARYKDYSQETAALQAAESDIMDKLLIQLTRGNHELK